MLNFSAWRNGTMEFRTSKLLISNFLHFDDLKFIQINLFIFLNDLCKYFIERKST